MDTSKEAYLNDCQKLNTSTDALYTLQKNLMEKLLINNDGNDSSPSSRKIFITKLRKYVIENSVEHRTIYFLEGISYAPPTQPAVALSFLCILLDVIQLLYANELPESSAFVPPQTFYDGSLQYFHFDRVGGVLTHLKRHYRDELLARLGSEHDPAESNDDPISGIYNGVELSDICKIHNVIFFQTLAKVKPRFRSFFLSIDSAMFLLTGNPRSSLNNLRPEVRSADLLASLNVGNGSSSHFTKVPETPVKPGDVSAPESLKSLLDCCILYYYAVAHKYIIMVSFRLSFALDELKH